MIFDGFENGLYTKIWEFLFTVNTYWDHLRTILENISFKSKF